ncbi:hypothetical protein ACC687_41650, partial [Rhizobium ruizarguesonis]
LLKWNVSTDPKRDELVVEYQELIAELSKEIEGALDASILAGNCRRTAVVPSSMVHSLTE